MSGFIAWVMTAFLFVGPIAFITMSLVGIWSDPRWFYSAVPIGFVWAVLLIVGLAVRRQRQSPFTDFRAN